MSKRTRYFFPKGHSRKLRQVLHNKYPSYEDMEGQPEVSLFNSLMSKMENYPGGCSALLTLDEKAFLDEFIGEGLAGRVEELPIKSISGRIMTKGAVINPESRDHAMLEYMDQMGPSRRDDIAGYANIPVESHARPFQRLLTVGLVDHTFGESDYRLSPEGRKALKQLDSGSTVRVPKEDFDKDWSKHFEDKVW